MKYTKVQVGNTTWYRFGESHEIRIDCLGLYGLLCVKVFKRTDTIFEDLVESVKMVCSLEKDNKLQWEIVADNKFLDCVARRAGFQVHRQFRPRHKRSILVKVYQLKEPLY